MDGARGMLATVECIGMRIGPDGMEWEFLLQDLRHLHSWNAVTAVWSQVE